MNAIRIALNVGSIILVVVLGALFVRIGLGVAQPESLYAPEPIIAPSSSVPSDGALVSYDFSSDPFSFGEITFDPLELIEDVPETTLDIKLKGIVSESNATFRLSDGKDKPVKIGEEVMNNVTLIQTAKDFVMLDVNGESQKLTLERVKLGEKPNAQSIVRAEPKPNLPTRQDVENLFSKVQLTPSMDSKSNRIQGFKIRARSGADLSAFNLRSGDILTRVGPVLLNSKQTNIKELHNLMSNGGAKDFEVIRDGAPVTILIGQ